MHLSWINRITGIIAIITMIILFGPARSSSQFLSLDDDDESEDKYQDESVKMKGDKPNLPVSVARRIKAEQLPGMKGVVKITWVVSSDYVDDFLVGRYDEVIDTKDKALDAETVQVVESGPTNEVYDFPCAAGNFFYMALSKKSMNNNDIRLYKDENYTSGPVVIAKSEIYYHVRGIDAKTPDSKKVKITWQKLQDQGLVYSLYRGTRRLDKAEKLESAVKIAELTDGIEFVDEKIDIPGIYYYAVTAREKKGAERFFPYPDHNYTTNGVRIIIEKVKQDDLYKIQSIEAQNEGKGVKVFWNYSGSVGGRYYRIFRSNKTFTKANQVMENLFISDVDIQKKNFFDPIPPGGLFYYGILPYGYTEENPDIIRGVNITNTPVTVAEQKKKKAEKKEKQEEFVDFSSDNVDQILHKTFFKGKFDLCIKALDNLIPKSDNGYEKAKAKLFLGRSYVEMHDYRKALDYFIFDDVKKHFPKEARFWQERALIHIK